MQHDVEGLGILQRVSCHSNVLCVHMVLRLDAFTVHCHLVSCNVLLDEEIRRVESEWLVAARVGIAKQQSASLWLETAVLSSRGRPFDGNDRISFKK